MNLADGLTEFTGSYGKMTSQNARLRGKVKVREYDHEEAYELGRTHVDWWLDSIREPMIEEFVHGYKHGWEDGIREGMKPSKEPAGKGKKK
jgi:hypothetical protein